MKHLFANVFPTQPNVKRKLITQISYKLNSCSSTCHSFMLLFQERKKIPNISHSESRKSNKIFKTSLDFNYVKPTVVLNGITKKWIAQRCVAYFWRPKSVFWKFLHYIQAPLTPVSFERNRQKDRMTESRPPLFFNFRGGILSSLLSKNHSKCLKMAIYEKISTFSPFRSFRGKIAVFSRFEALWGVFGKKWRK